MRLPFSSRATAPSNTAGSRCTPPPLAPRRTTGSSALAARCELGAVLYQYNVLGTRGPRKMTAIVPQASATL